MGGSREGVRQEAYRRSISTTSLSTIGTWLQVWKRGEEGTGGYSDVPKAQVSLLYPPDTTCSQCFPRTALGSPHLLALPGATQRPRQAPNTNPPLQQPLAAASPCSCSQELCTTLPAPGKPWEAPAPPPWELETSPRQAELTALHLNVDLIQAQCPTHQLPAPQPPRPRGALTVKRGGSLGCGWNPFCRQDEISSRPCSVSLKNPVLEQRNSSSVARASAGTAPSPGPHGAPLGLQEQRLRLEGHPNSWETPVPSPEPPVRGGQPLPRRGPCKQLTGAGRPHV